VARKPGIHIKSADFTLNWMMFRFPIFENRSTGFIKINLERQWKKWYLLYLFKKFINPISQGQNNSKQEISLLEAPYQFVYQVWLFKWFFLQK
jgi:hypothetical protein